MCILTTPLWGGGSRRVNVCVLPTPLWGGSRRVNVCVLPTPPPPAHVQSSNLPLSNSPGRGLVAGVEMMSQELEMDAASASTQDVDAAPASTQEDCSRVVVSSISSS